MSASQSRTFSKISANQATESLDMQGPYDAVWHRPQQAPSSHPFSFHADPQHLNPVHAPGQAQANLGLLPTGSGTLPDVLSYDASRAFQVRLQPIPHLLSECTHTRLI